MQRKVVLGLSGGMDSAYVALKLIDSGFEVIGVHIFMSDDCDGREEARKLAAVLDIELIIIDARSRFEDKVIVPFVQDYINGRTPNPCVKCNPCVKVKILAEVADELGVKMIATGHYAKPAYKNGRHSFAPAVDASKDQAYFLYGLPQELIERLLLPLADVTKKDIKAFFNSNSGFSFANGESNDICFAANGYRDIIERYTVLPPAGNFVDRAGDVLGRHNGIYNYTVGQRKGLGVSLGRPAYVVDINADDNTVVLAFLEDSVISSFKVKDIVYLSALGVCKGQRYKVRVRYRSKPVWCSIDNVTDGVISVAFDAPQKVTACGQSAVFYDEADIIAFGGIICR